MRFYVGVCCLLSVLIVLVQPGYGDETRSARKRRFLGDWEVMPENMFRMSDFAKELTTSLTTSFQQLFPQSFRRHDEEVVAPALTPSIRGPSRSSPLGDRELEGDDDDKTEASKPEVAVEKRPTKPDRELSAGMPFHVPFSLSFGLLAPWWNGPNVCVDRSEVDEPDEESIELPGVSFNLQSTQCMPTESNYVCTKTIQTNGLKKTIIVRRQCCHGYVRRSDGRPGCSAVEMESVLDTMKNLEMTKFIQLIESAGMMERILEKNVSVFAPSNDAVIDYEDETEDNEISALNSYRHQKDWEPVVQGHICDGFLNLDNVDNEDLMDTVNADAKIRINKYEPAHEVVTANCVPITGKNTFATNGMVHLLSGVLQFPTKTVGEIIETEPQYSTFKKLLEQHGLMSDLKNKDKVWTVFLPSDEAFVAADPALVKQMENGEGCTEGILKNHMMKGTVCTAAIVSQARVKNMLENVLKMTKDVEDSYKIEGASLTSTDKMATNGVIHSIDKILVPQEAQSILKVIEDEGRTDLLDLIEVAGMLSTFEELRNVTFFMPSEEALKKWMNETRSEREDAPELVKQVLLHHIAEPRTSVKMFSHNKILKTADGQSIALKLHELFPGMVTGATAQCAYLTSHDTKACGAIVHKVNKVLRLSAVNMLDAIKDMEEHKILNKLLEGTGIAKKLSEEGPFTFLAPTDEAFEGFGKEELEELYQDDSRAEEMLKSHILPETLCCSDISHPSPFHRQYVRTYGGNLLPLHRGLHGKVRFGRAGVDNCDIAAKNGIVHSVDMIIIPRRRASIFDMWPL